MFKALARVSALFAAICAVTVSGHVHAHIQNPAVVNGKAVTNTFLGPCPRTYVPLDFNMTEFMGSWYQLARFGYYKTHHRCVEVNFTMSEKPIPHIDFSIEYDYANVVGRGLPLRWQHIHEVGIAKIQERTGTKRKWLIKTEPSDNFDKDIFPFWVLATDYKNYALVWSCRSHRVFFNQQFAWVMTRKRVLPPNDPEHTKEKILQELKAFGYQPYDFIVTNQTSCAA